MRALLSELEKCARKKKWAGGHIPVPGEGHSLVWVHAPGLDPDDNTNRYILVVLAEELNILLVDTTKDDVKVSNMAVFLHTEHMCLTDELVKVDLSVGGKSTKVNVHVVSSLQSPTPASEEMQQGRPPKTLALDTPLSLGHFPSFKMSWRCPRDTGDDVALTSSTRSEIERMARWLELRFQSLNLTVSADKTLSMAYKFTKQKLRPIVLDPTLRLESGEVHCGKTADGKPVVYLGATVNQPQSYDVALGEEVKSMAGMPTRMADAFLDLAQSRFGLGLPRLCNLYRHNLVDRFAKLQGVPTKKTIPPQPPSDFTRPIVMRQLESFIENGCTKDKDILVGVKTLPQKTTGKITALKKDKQQREEQPWFSHMLGTLVDGGIGLNKTAMDTTTI
ncbi:Hypp5385 [Branchiostoma lanceolatum]|uniref:Hypp5385 protein n=1 Tax=Branchiostoma lanceolatum TaxID=7740 RepID=A0A8K0AEW9_BRALA|nr:Hypp5385 [Branchiostoma lanceolatum]